MPRQARLDAPGTLHHVIVRGIEQRDIVRDDRDRLDFVSRMGTVATNTSTAIFAWALMTNHAHFLVRSGSLGLSTFMRRFLSGYASGHNKRHKRHGHLFQNRYKSIVCEEDAYFMELVRYIHLNPLRANSVESLARLDRYRWCGHAVLMGRIRNEWQDRDYVLNWFGAKEGEARRAYREFVKMGIAQGRRPDLTGGGLIRSHGGWLSVKSMRRLGVREQSDERILGSGEFVEKLIEQADRTRREQFSAQERLKRAASLVEALCERESISLEALRSGSRRKDVSRVRCQLARDLIEQCGLPLSEAGRHLGISTSGIAKILSRSEPS